MPEVDGLTVELGGQAFAEFEPPESELIGLAFAIVVLIVAFGSVLAMGLPIGVALAGVGTGVGLITLLSKVMAVPEFATTLGAMIGLGVGIDYALFIVTRYRERLHAGHENEAALVGAIDTAGRAVDVRRHHRGHLPRRHAGHRASVRLGSGDRRGHHRARSR